SDICAGADIASPIGDAMKKADEDYNSNAYLCRSYQLEDNLESIQAVKAGDVLDFHIDLIAGHHPGYVNVSVVDLTTNQVIGEPLRHWADWPDSTSGPPRNDINFNITIPDTLSSACDVPGKCAIQ
ncbi:cytochrome P450, partial [Apiospora arundinis]